MEIKRAWARSALFLLSVLLVITAAACRGTPPPPTQSPVSLRMGGADAMQQLARDLVTGYHQAKPYVTVTLQISNSDNGLRDLARGALDLTLSSRPLNTDDLNRRPVKVVEIARDGIVLVVHPDNPLEGLTKEQVARIFAGEIINWSELKIAAPGGIDAIQVISREGTSGTRRVFEDMLMTGRRLTPTALVQSGERSVLSYVNAHPNAIGYVSFAGARNNSQVHTLDIDGVSPTLPTIKAGEFPLVRPLYLVVPTDAGPDVTAFVDWIQSDAGQAIISDYAGIPKK